MQSTQIDLSFPKNFDVQILSELPNQNCSHLFYPGGTTNGGKDGILIEVSPELGSNWIGTFAKDLTYPNSLNKVLAWINPNKIFVISSGVGFIVNVFAPTKYEVIGIEPIIQAIPIPEKNMFVFSDYTNVTAYSEDGMLWQTDRISWNGLKIDSIHNSYLQGTYFDVKNDEDSSFIVDLSDGKVIRKFNNFNF